MGAGAIAGADAAGAAVPLGGRSKSTAPLLDAEVNDIVEAIAHQPADKQQVKHVDILMDGKLQQLPQHLHLPRQHRLEAFVGRFAHIAGTLPSLFLVFAGSLTWVFCGIPLHFNNLWQIIMNDAGSLVCWFWDILLLIGQAQSTDTFIAHVCGWVASSQDQLAWAQGAIEEGAVSPSKVALDLLRKRDEPGRMPSPAIVDRVADGVAWGAGTPFAQIMNIVGVAIWLGFGPSRQWNNTWQLDINTAYAQQILLLTPFLHNRQHRHARYLSSCLARIQEADDDISLRLLGACTDPAPPVIDVPAEAVRPKSMLEVFIHAIVRAVGSCWGLLVACLVIIVWASIGSPMDFSDSWWLMLNTITGVLGFIFSYMVRYAIRRDYTRIAALFAVLDAQDRQLMALLGIDELPERPERPKPSFFVNLSRQLGLLLSTPQAVLGSILFVLGLLAAGGSLSFNFLGQLICNTPTMIFEGWNLHFLLPAHAMAHSLTLEHLEEVLYHRRLLQDALGHLTTTANCKSQPGQDAAGSTDASAGSKFAALALESAAPAAGHALG